MNKLKNILALVTVGVFGLVSTAHAAIDLTDVTDGISAMEVAILAVVGVVIASGLGLNAVKFGGRWLMKVFKSFSS